LLKYVRLYIACGNLKVNVNQVYNLQKKTKKKKTGNVRRTVKMWCGYVNIVDVEKQ
jgi:hypothetical protein